MWTTVALILASAALAARTVGDGRQSGFTKTDRSTSFAKADDSIYTPLVTLLLLGALGALYLSQGAPATI